MIRLTVNGQRSEISIKRRIDEGFKEIYLGKDVRNRTLLEVFKVHNDMVKSRVGVDFSTSTYKRYQTTLDHVSNFLLRQYKLGDILLKQIQYSFITDLEHYLKTIRKCNHNSTQKYIRNFRKIINNAIKNDWLDRDPFKAYRVKLKDTKRVFLTKEELTALEEKQFAIERLGQETYVSCGTAYFCHDGHPLEWDSD